ncbi:MAG: catechol 2,3-dioxygenase [Gammaproteobacteria bacterium]|jgi:catechol 2,3-dioxygenase
MSATEALWSTTLHHCVVESEEPARLVDFYTDALQMSPSALPDGRTAMSGQGRTLIIANGKNETVPQVGFNVGGHNRLGVLRDVVDANGVQTSTVESPLFDGEAFEITDPEGLQVTFGCALPQFDTGATPPTEPGHLSGRLQHIVYASPDPDAVSAFYQRKLGFVHSDTVLRDEDGANTAIFVRSDHEHHSFACFRSPEFRFDHIALETSGWLDIRDWADHFAEREIPIWWGPGRHGPGNNLFFMIRDPDGNRIEISAECEHMPQTMGGRIWPHNERTLNLWGASWMRV